MPSLPVLLNFYNTVDQPSAIRDEKIEDLSKIIIQILQFGKNLKMTFGRKLSSLIQKYLIFHAIKQFLNGTRGHPILNKLIVYF